MPARPRPGGPSSPGLGFERRLEDTSALYFDKALLAVGGGALADPAMAQDACAGAVIIKSCALYHSAAWQPLIGPHPNVGADCKTGRVPKFSYSEALHPPGWRNAVACLLRCSDR